MTHEDKRLLRPALWKAFKTKCPNCGEGKLLAGYLKVVDHCAACNEDYTHQRADDGPAWATMLIVGHLIPPIVMGIYEGFDEPTPWKVAIFLGIFVTVITLLLLPRIKAMFVAIQWANRMHGFGSKPPQPAQTPKNKAKLAAN